MERCSLHLANKTYSTAHGEVGKIPLGDGSNFVYLMQKNDDTENLFKLMDLVDGTAYGQYTRLGKTFNGNTMVCVPRWNSFDW